MNTKHTVTGGDETGTQSRPAELLDMTGRVVLVTGASGNIGAGIARRFWMAGATVVAHTHTSSADELRKALLGEFAEELIGELTGDPVLPRFTAATADLTTTKGPRQLVDEVLSAHGRIDVLVNNAGIQPTVPFKEITDQQWQEMIDTNLTAAHRLTQAVATAMRAGGGAREGGKADSADSAGKASSAGGSSGGSIVHVASIEAHHPTVEHGHYATAKAGLVMHAKAAALSYGADGIRVNSVSPGLISRPGLDKQWPEGVERWQNSAPLRRLGTPADVGDACLFLCSGLARWITGIDLVVDGGVLTHPTW